MSDTARERPICWALSEGAIGMEVQAVGLAEALGYAPRVMRLAIRPPWRWLPPRLWPAPLAAPGPGGDVPAPPWPDVVVSCGRKVVAVAAAIRRMSGARAIHIQDPRVPAAWFDALVVPEHDSRDAPNAVRSLGALNRVTPARLAEGAAAVAERLGALPRPLVAVLVGGTNRHLRLGPAEAGALGRRLAAMAGTSGCGLAVSASRRTGRAATEALIAGLGAAPAVVWTPESDWPNPYFGYLALADAIVVTADSVNMTTEALSTGRPVHVVDLPGRPGKFGRFHADLRARGLTRRFEGGLEDWRYEPLDETRRVAAALRAHLAATGRPLPGSLSH